MTRRLHTLGRAAAAALAATAIGAPTATARPIGENQISAPVPGYVVPHAGAGPSATTAGEAGLDWGSAGIGAGAGAGVVVLVLGGVALGSRSRRPRSVS